jgi:hypothetical protein
MNRLESIYNFVKSFLFFSRDVESASLSNAKSAFEIRLNTIKNNHHEVKESECNLKKCLGIPEDTLPKFLDLDTYHEKVYSIPLIDAKFEMRIVYRQELMSYGSIGEETIEPIFGGYLTRCELVHEGKILRTSSGLDVDQHQSRLRHSF